MPRRRLRWVACLIVVALVSVACGGGETAAESADRESDQRDLPGASAMSADPQELAEAIDAAGALSGLFTAPHGLQGCALRPTGEAACWGEYLFPPDALEGVFAGITHGFAHVCGLRASGEVECWEHEQFSFAGEPDTPEGVFAAVDAAGRWTCGLLHGGAVECWGDVLELLEGVEPPVADVTFPGGEFASISVGGAHACGLRPGGEVACWGTNWFGQADAPPGPFVSVDAGASHSCGLRPDGSIDCWGEDSKDAAFLTVGASRFGGDEAAYVADSRDTEEWALFPSPVAFMDLEGAVPEAELREEMARRAAGWEPPAGPFVAVSAGDGFTCGLRLDGEVACWGYFAREEPRIPLEVYADVYGSQLRDFYKITKAQVKAGVPFFDRRFYGLYESLYGARVWELDPAEYLIAGPEAIPVESMVADLELIDPPSGPFIAIEAGWRHICGLRPDGELDCWGIDDANSAPPPGPFATAHITPATTDG